MFGELESCACAIILCLGSGIFFVLRLVMGGLADTAGALSTVERFELRQRMT
jgi:hypothetical protein